MELDANLINHIFKLKCVYVRRSRELGREESSKSLCEAEPEEVTTRVGMKRRHPVGFQTETMSASSTESTNTTGSSLAWRSRVLPSISRAPTSSDPGGSTQSSTSNLWPDRDYNTYLSVLNMIIQ